MKTWEVRLPKELEDYVDSLLARKSFDSVDMLMAYAVSLLQEALNMEDAIPLEHLRQELAEGIEQAKRGETRDAEEVFGELLADLSA